MSDFQSFLDSVMHIPAEFERNITLLRTLDTRVNESMDAFNDLIKKYKETDSKTERLRIRGEIDKLEKKLDSYSLDKCAVADQTYRLIDDIVVQMNLLKTQNGKDKEEMTPLLINMPEDDYEPRYCDCRGISYGEMVACDNEDCPIEWFHYGCVGITDPPKGKWYCKDCKDHITIRLPKISLDGPKSQRKTAPKSIPKQKSKPKSKPKSGTTKRKNSRA